MAGNIKSGVTIFGVTGTFSGWVDNSVAVMSNGVFTNGISVSSSGFYLHSSGTGGDLNSSVSGGWNTATGWLYSHGSSTWTYPAYKCQFTFNNGTTPPKSVTINFRYKLIYTSQSWGSISYKLQASFRYIRTTISSGKTSSQTKIGVSGAGNAVSIKYTASTISPSGYVTASLTATPATFTNSSTATYEYAGIVNVDVLSASITDAWSTDDASLNSNLELGISSILINRS